MELKTNQHANQHDSKYVNQYIFFISLISAFLFLMMPVVLGATVSITQSGADTGTVMKGEAFTLTVSGLSESGTATVVVPSGFSISEDTTKSFSGSSVSWTTFVVDQKMSSQTISVLISTLGSPTTVTTSSFDVVLTPSLSITATPSSYTVATAGTTFDLSINVQNTGETTAQNIVATITSNDSFTVDSSMQTINIINAGSSSAVAWTVTASTSQTLTITVTSSNADTKNTTVALICSDCTSESDDENDNNRGGGESSSYSLSSNTTLDNMSNITSKNTSMNISVVANPKKFGDGEEQKVNYPRGIGLLSNEKVLVAMEKVLAKGKLSERAKANLIEKAEVIRGDINISRKINTKDNKTDIVTTVKYFGKQKVHNLMLYEIVPKNIASDTSKITVTTTGTVEIVNFDPEYLITFPEVTKDTTFTINYGLTGTYDQSVIDGIITEVYVESLEDPIPIEQKKKGSFDTLIISYGVIIFIILTLIVYVIVKRRQRNKPI
jgi:hypothetical protein